MIIHDVMCKPSSQHISITLYLFLSLFFLTIHYKIICHHWSYFITHLPNFQILQYSLSQELPYFPSTVISSLHWSSFIIYPFYMCNICNLCSLKNFSNFSSTVSYHKLSPYLCHLLVFYYRSITLTFGGVKLSNTFT